MATKKTTTKKTSKATGTKAPAKAKKATPQPAAKKAKAAGSKPAKKLSQINAAIRVLAEAEGPMNCKQMVEAMQAKGYWASPGGKTPSQTLYSAILRDIRKGAEARFVKADRGQFALKK